MIEPALTALECMVCHRLWQHASMQNNAWREMKVSVEVSEHDEAMAMGQAHCSQWHKCMRQSVAVCGQTEVIHSDKELPAANSNNLRK